MKKEVFIIVTSFFMTNTVLAQADTSRIPNYPKDKCHAISFGVNIPVGEFSETHIAGISLNYTWSHYRFGKK